MNNDKLRKLIMNYVAVHLDDEDFLTTFTAMFLGVHNDKSHH